MSKKMLHTMLDCKAATLSSFIMWPGRHRHHEGHPEQVLPPAEAVDLLVIIMFVLHPIRNVPRRLRCLPLILPLPATHTKISPNPRPWLRYPLSHFRRPPETSLHPRLLLHPL